jgi:hypothetical protein
MTLAICFKCGKGKFGAFNSCQACQAMPRNENDFVLSMALSDHYFQKPALDQMGADIAAGKSLQLDPDTRRVLIGVLRETGMFRGVAKAADVPVTPPPKKKPWWRAIF